jgi:RND family efflux transporter MFP subunit
MSMSRRSIGIAATAAIVVMLSVGVFLRIRAAAGEAGDAAPSPGGERPDVSASQTFSTDIAIPVEGAEVIRDTLVVSVSAAAQAAAVKQARLLAEVQGRITQVHVDENDLVGGGSVLIEIDPTEYTLAVDRAAAALARAQATHRELTLFDDQIEDPEIRAERDRVARAKSGLDEAQVGLREAELQLARTSVRAPFRGRVASLRVVEGQLARVGDELLSVVDLDPIKVEVQVLESEVGYLAAGRNASISFSAFPGESLRGTVATVNPLVERDTRTARVTVMVPNPGGRILPGMYARVSLEARSFPDRILVPRSAILERDRREMLFVYEPRNQEAGLAKWRYVTTGLMNDSLVEVIEHPETDMVQPGEIVLTDGHYTLIHDARIRMVADVRVAGGRPQ